MKDWKVWTSVAMTAAVLPIVLLGATSPTGLRFLTQADEVEEMRIWFEPDSVVTQVGDMISLTVMGETNTNGPLPKVEMEFRTAGGIEVIPQAIQYNQAFSGRVKLGEVRVIANSRGAHELKVLEASVNTLLPDLTVVTDPAKILVK